MDTNYRANIAKWLPPPSCLLEKWFRDSLALDETMGKLAGNIALIIKDPVDRNVYDSCISNKLVENLETITQRYESLLELKIPNHPVYRYKVNYLLTSLKRSLIVVAKFTRNLIMEIVDGKNDEMLRIIFKLVNSYNRMLQLEHQVTDPSIDIFYNDSPSILEPLKRISITKVLQILARNKAEEYCHELIDCLLANYQPRNDKDDRKSPVSADIDVSENSSLEIYRALTKHLTPPVTSVSDQEFESNFESLQTLVNAQNEEVMRLLRAAQEVSPSLLGTDAWKISKDSEGQKLRRSAVKKVSEYYQEVVWAAVSSILDHVVLWWSPEALATHHSHGAQHLKDWLHHFINANDVLPSVRPALQNLCDALGSHVTTTVWDQLFRLAYLSSFECQSKAASTEGTDTGQMFAEVFQLLVTLSNECEVGGEWVIGAPIMELPLSEQIIVLHRLDHSIHTMRLWAMKETRIIAHTWDLDAFFLLVKGDLVNCLEELSYIKLADHSNEFVTESLSVQVYVCGKMRAKIVSEVNVNIQLLKESSTKCIDILAKICRVVSLANLHMCFPSRSYWRVHSNVAPSTPSPYVDTYFERVLLPVLEVLEDHEISNMILRIMCEAWLDYIYLHRIKFSEYGAHQLLTDFAHVSSWVSECGIVSQNVRNHLLKNEVLRRCEGVGRLLLRHPGESIAMNKKLPQRTNENGSPESLGLERMPAEMYVPNQEQWLELRASKRYNFCCTE